MNTPPRRFGGPNGRVSRGQSWRDNRGLRRWLDFGAGNGGLVRHVATHHPGIEIAGFDTGSWATRARDDGLPILSEAELAHHIGRYDVVTAIEVLEHVVDPIALLRTIRTMLRPDGLFFYTTGNARKAPSNFAAWSYVAPEIHVSYFTPEAMAIALGQAGFRVEPRGPLPGDTEIVLYKILKALRQTRHRPWHKLLPWFGLPWLAGRMLGLAAMPLGRAD